MAHKRPRLDSCESVSDLEPDESDWHCVLTLPCETLSVHEAPEDICCGLLQVHPERLSVYHHGKQYNIPPATHWPLNSLCNVPNDWPFRMYCYFYVDSQNMVHVRYLELWLHDEQFSKTMNEHGTVSKEVALTRFFRSSMSNCLGSTQCVELLEHKTDCEANESADSQTVCTNNNTTWNEQFPLYHHQQQTVNWMAGIEHKTATNQAWIQADLTCVPVGHTGWVYNRSKDIFVSIDPENHRLTPISYRGGILGDAPGTGKTATILALMARDHEPPATRYPDMSCLIDGDTFFPSRATLIVVPQNLPQMWEEQIAKFLTIPGLRITKLLSHADLERATEEDLTDSDIILTTYWFLRTKKYDMLVEQRVREALNDYDSQPYLMVQPHVLRTATRAARQSGIWPCPLLQSCWFKRIVYDDVEHIFVSGNQRRSVRNIPRFHGESIWGLTNSLDIGPEGFLSDYCSVFNCEPLYWTPSLIQTIVETCFRHYSLQPVVPIETHVHRIPLSTQEHRLWQFYSQDMMLPLSEQIQLCCYFNLPADHGRANDTIRLERLDTIIRTIKEDKQRRLHNAQRTLEIQRETEKALRKKLRQDRVLEQTIRDRPDREEFIQCQQRIEKNIDRLEKMLEAISKTLLVTENLNKSLSYFENVAESVSMHSGLCPICYECEADVITTCGHTFCRPCLMMNLRNQHRCPLCQGNLTSHDAFQIMRSRIDVYGSKLVHLLNFIHATLEQHEKIVIYCQYVPLIRVLRTILQEQDIRTGSVSGNTNCRQSALSKFAAGNIDVLLIHLASISSGMNLQEANHIVFLHALVGDCSQLEKQAIAQVHRPQQTKTVHVHWFIAEQTIEDSLFASRTAHT